MTTIKRMDGSVLVEREGSVREIIEALVKEGANLEEADLRRANFLEANLEGANLARATLERANLQEASLWRADLLEANLRRASLRGADLQGANLRRASLRGADLLGANLQGANLQGADLLGADLQGASLLGTDLQGASLRRANLQGANLQGADLQGAYFEFNDKKIEITKKPLQIDTGDYHVIIFDKIMKIGYEMHTIEEWFSFDDKKIAEMDGKRSIKFWRQWKEPLKVICEKRQQTI